jgi:hypothetical protein
VQVELSQQDILLKFLGNLGKERETVAMQTLDYLHEVRQGNPSLLAGLFEKALISQQVTVRGRRDGEELHLLFESDQSLDPELLCTYVRAAFLALNLSPRMVHLYGRRVGQESASWQHQIDWSPTAEPTPDQPIVLPADAPAGMALEDSDHSGATDTSGSLDSLSYSVPTGQADLPMALVSSSTTPTRSGQAAAKRSRLLLGLAILTLAGGGIWFYQHHPASKTNSSPVVVDNPTPKATPTPAGLITQARQAGWLAALAAQKANTPAEWGQVALLWQEAILLLEKVSPQSPAGQAIQPKIREYRQNRAIALQRKQAASKSQ